MSEMADMARQGTDCWLTRTDKMAKLLKVPDIQYSEFSGKYVLRKVQCRFDRFWLNEISSTRVGPDGNHHNKLRTYSSLKGFFGTEPYVEMHVVNNRNQRCHLSRLRVSAHRLGCEVQRYKRPAVPRDQRFCAYCPPVQGPGGQPVRHVDDECHCLIECIVGKKERPNLLTSFSSRNSTFATSCNVGKFKMLVCPSNPTDAKLVREGVKKKNH